MRWLREVVSKNKGWENLFAFVLLLFAVTASFFLALSVLGWTELLGSGAANWVQAFGSIAAIFGAAWLADNSRRRDRAERKRDLLYKEIKAINRVMAGADRVISKATALNQSLHFKTPVSSNDAAADLNSSIEMLKIAMDGIDEAGGIWVLCYETAQKIPRVFEKANTLIRLIEFVKTNGEYVSDGVKDAIARADVDYKHEVFNLIDSAMKVRAACRSFIANPGIAG